MDRNSNLRINIIKTKMRYFSEEKRTLYLIEDMKLGQKEVMYMKI